MLTYSSSLHLPGQPGEHFRDPAAESTANQERQSTRRPEMPRELTAGEPAGEEAAADDQGTKTSQATPKAGQYQGNPLSHGEQTEPKDADGGHQGYVRSTGFAADGGNFDARQPGAGREADRKETPCPSRFVLATFLASE